MSANITNRYIGTRRLLYARDGELERREFTAYVCEPFLLTEGSVDFAFDDGVAGCVIGFDGLAEKDMTIFGADTLQAIAIAVSALETYMKRLRNKYNFYFLTGEYYFEQ